MPRKTRQSNLIGLFSPNNSVEVGYAEITNNVDKTDITESVSDGGCSFCTGCKDDNRDVEFVLGSPNAVTAGLGNMIYITWIGRTVGLMSIEQPARGKSKKGSLW